MKIKALHPKKNFLKFLILVLLVLGGSVGVILATQKQVFDDSKARECECNKYNSCGANYHCSNQTCGTCVKNTNSTPKPKVTSDPIIDNSGDGCVNCSYDGRVSTFYNDGYSDSFTCSSGSCTQLKACKAVCDPVYTPHDKCGRVGSFCVKNSSLFCCSSPLVCTGDLPLGVGKCLYK